ncbi:hypothetical protein [Thalassococcus sp. S3]|uniref:hypothetical protein n=1 Tax=Thalassococcus sp. S3 TaxID=2017482 RepID=UPI0010245D19|nr:hypothetical protein [Thalassococcus sp. S3]QBF32646.1 hypothetical protein CFI11_15680 [Thalassococcus sp. S3]
MFFARGALAAALATLPLIANPAFGDEPMSIEKITVGYKTHAAMTQLHRWYLLYEEPRYGIENQLDILTEDVRITSGLGEAKGHAQYAERLQQIPTEWQNAHDVKSTDLQIAEDGTISLTANVTYLNKGALPDNSVRTADLTYTTRLVPSESALPKFSEIEIGQNSDGVAEKFIPEYGTNRMLSLVHYWLALIEDPARNPEPVREILAEDFSLNFSSGAITDFDGFKAWLAGPASAVKASTHEIGAFAQESTGENTYEVTMTFDWNGIAQDDTHLLAKTRHVWLVEDDPTERFARIKTVDVEMLEPFRPAE